MMDRKKKLLTGLALAAFAALVVWAVMTVPQNRSCRSRLLIRIL